MSAAGRRAGIKDGTRSGLWAVFAEAIDALRPQYVVIENVRGLLSATAHRAVESDDTVVGDRSDRPVLRALGAVLGDLSDLRYDAVWTTIAAASVGAPHRRERVFIVATAADSQSGAGRDEEQQRVSPLRLRGESDVQQPQERSGSHALSGGNAPHASRNGWDEGRPESARIVGGSDAAVSGDEPGVALLPTPCAQQSGNTPENHLAKKPGRKVVTDLAILVENGLLESGGALLPTPTAQDGANNGGPSQFQRNTLPLNAEVKLLPTPNASDCTGGGAHPDAREGHSRQLIDFALLAGSTAWGKYEPAIRRWEQIVGPAPAPTEPNKNNNPRLSAAFSEWLMGWPAGWVTDPAISISRNDQLRIVGNGVCTQQAIAALRYLLGVTTGTHTHTPGRADVTATTLLPTPRASDPAGVSSRSSEGFRPQLGEVVRTLGLTDSEVDE